MTPPIVNSNLLTLKNIVNCKECLTQTIKNIYPYIRNSVFKIQKLMVENQNLFYDNETGSDWMVEKQNRSQQHSYVDNVFY